MKHILLLFTILISFNTFTNAQNYKREYAKIAKESIIKLNDGVLLVRLTTKEKTINALKKRNQLTAAKRYEKEQKALNATIVSAFEMNFDFCPIYYFYSDQSKKIKANNLSEVTWVNSKTMATDTSIIVDNDNFLVAEFGILAQDTAKYFSSYERFSDGKKGLEIRETYYGGSNLSQKGLIVKSNEYVPLPKPFPRFTKTSMFEDKEVVYIKAVKKLNEKLTDYSIKIGN